MASMCASAFTAVFVSWAPPRLPPSPSPSPSSSSSSAASSSVRCGGARRRSHVVRMAPEEQRTTRSSPFDFPAEWERAPRRPDIFPKFSPMKIPLPIPLPVDPPLQIEEEEYEGEEDPDEEEEDQE